MLNYQRVLDLKERRWMAMDFVNRFSQVSGFFPSKSEGDLTPLREPLGELRGPMDPTNMVIFQKSTWFRVPTSSINIHDYPYDSLKCCCWNQQEHRSLAFEVMKTRRSARLADLCVWIHPCTHKKKLRASVIGEYVRFLYDHIRFIRVNR